MSNFGRKAAIAAVAFATVGSTVFGGGYLGSASSAYAGGEPDVNVGSPGRDGQDATCVAPVPPQENLPVCNVVGENGGDGTPGAVYRR